jgi:hypothetical protein
MTRKSLNGHARIESKLMDSEARYRRLFEAAKDGILILDAESGKITDSNPFLETMLGYGHDELLTCRPGARRHVRTDGVREGESAGCRAASHASLSTARAIPALTARSTGRSRGLADRRLRQTGVVGDAPTIDRIHHDFIGRTPVATGSLSGSLKSDFPPTAVMNP